MNARSYFFAAMLFALGAAACGDDTTVDDADEATEEAALSQAGKALIGSYAGGATFRKLVLTAEKVGQANRYWAEILVGTSGCTAPPCNAARIRIEGTFTAGKKTITLRPNDGPTPDAPVYGRFTYTVDGSIFQLVREQPAFTDTLTRVQQGSEDGCVDKGEAACLAAPQCSARYEAPYCTPASCNPGAFLGCAIPDPGTP